MKQKVSLLSIIGWSQSAVNGRCICCVGGVDGIFICGAITWEPATSQEGHLPTLVANAVNHSWKNAQTQSVLFFRLTVLFFFASVRARTFSLNCAVKIGININTLYISWRGGQTSLFNGISCCFNENFKIMLLCYFFLKLFVLAILHYFFSNYAANLLHRHLFVFNKF